MNITVDPQTRSDAVNAAIAQACKRIAPTWPLDQFIAVNPYWGWRTQPMPEVCAMLGALAGTPLTMPREWFRVERNEGRISDDDLTAAAIALGEPELASVAMRLLDTATACDQPTISTMALATDVREFTSSPRPGQTWTDLVTHHISQHCAAHFDEWQAAWHSGVNANLFTDWRTQLATSHGVPWQHGSAWVRGEIESLPTSAEAAIDVMLRQLNIPEAGHEHYLASLLLSVNGWAAWCAYTRWQARLNDQDDDEIVGLLAIRLAWDWLLVNDAQSPETASQWEQWSQSWTGTNVAAAAIAYEQRIDWVLQGAAERAYQNTISQQFSHADAARPTVPAAQAIFCIDVRSEVFRRALERVTPEVHTRGFAGFFGLPISYTPVGSDLTRPQLPGLLAPALNVTETPSDTDDGAAMNDERSQTFSTRQRWSKFRSAPSSVFSFVESTGLFYGAKLVKDSLPHAGMPPKWEHDGLSIESQHGLQPRLAMVTEDPVAAAAIAHRVLNAIGLVDGFAPIVMLCGHGSQSANNPHAAGLDCGACGGQTGEVNARVLADLLNAPAVRAELRELGIDIPATTSFVGALHNTTTDDVELFDTAHIPEPQRSQLAQLKSWLAAAGDGARAERAPHLDLQELVDDPQRLATTIRERANDWSQVRPEWGLAGNAAFIVAPRSRSKHMNLSGRSFLHDYDWRLDNDLSVLTLIMTAPMVVTNWINMQYFASTVDNQRYGSGNKVLHNVVAGRIGVFEGNGGDLRIGLSMQSLHDGHTLRHPPLRLSVFIEAPRDEIDSVIGAHAVVHDLVSNGWLHLLRIESSTGAVERWTATGWAAE